MSDSFLLSEKALRELRRIHWRRSVLESPGGSEFLLRYVKMKEQDLGEHRLGQAWLEYQALSAPQTSPVPL